MALKIFHNHFPLCRLTSSFTVRQEPPSATTGLFSLAFSSFPRSCFCQGMNVGTGFCVSLTAIRGPVTGDYRFEQMSEWLHSLWSSGSCSYAFPYVELSLPFSPQPFQNLQTRVIVLMERPFSQYYWLPGSVRQVPTAFCTKSRFLWSLGTLCSSYIPVLFLIRLFFRLLQNILTHYVFCTSWWNHLSVRCKS